MTGAQQEDELLYIGLRCIGALRRSGRQWEAFADPGRRTLGHFATHDQAGRAVYDADVADRLAGAARRSEMDT